MNIKLLCKFKKEKETVKDIVLSLDTNDCQPNCKLAVTILVCKFEVNIKLISEKQ